MTPLEMSCSARNNTHFYTGSSPDFQLTLALTPESAHDYFADVRSVSLRHDTARFWEPLESLDRRHDPSDCQVCVLG